MDTIKDKAAIVGIATTSFSKNSGKSEVRSICECIKEAVEDAGLKTSDIDGSITETSDAVDEVFIAKNLGIQNMVYFNSLRWGDGSSCALVQNAAMVVAAGVANYVVCYRAVNGATGRPEAPVGMAKKGMWAFSHDLCKQGFYPPFGLTTPAGQAAILVNRYMHDHGIKTEQLGWVTVACRQNAAKNPRALFYENPISIDDYRKSNAVVQPLRELDCSEEVDGAAAVIVTTAEKARHLKKLPAYVMAAAQSAMPECEWMTSYNRPDISRFAEIERVGQDLFSMAGVSPRDINVAQIDDFLAPLVPMQLEELGLCRRGEGVSFCEGGKRISPQGELPLNTAGGSLGEGHIFAMNHIVEAVRQVRGSSVNQAKKADLVLVAGGAGGPASGLILRR